MKRMVLIPEERLLRYEERDKQRTEHRDDIIYRKYIGNDSAWYSQNHEIKSRGITGTFKRKRRRYYVGRYGSSPIRRCPYTEIQYFRSGVGCDEIP